MARVMLIHWNAAEAEPRLNALTKAGHDASLFIPHSSTALKGLSADPPEAILVDLARLPSQGTAVAIELRRRKALRTVPTVFIGGLPEKLERPRQLLPDATFTTWPRIAAALRKALAAPPAHPVVPNTMAGYSGTPLPRKLGIKPEARVLLIDAPDAFEHLLDPLPAGAHLSRTPRGTFNLVLLFASSREDLVRHFDSSTALIASKGHLWIAWPKKTSRLAGDLTQDFVRAYGLDRLWVDFKICAIDADWSGLCFARR
jgi:hypothetical protein